MKYSYVGWPKNFLRKNVRDKPYWKYLYWFLGTILILINSYGQVRWYGQVSRNVGAIWDWIWILNSNTNLGPGYYEWYQIRTSLIRIIVQEWTIPKYMNDSRPYPNEKNYEDMRMFARNFKKMILTTGTKVYFPF